MSDTHSYAESLTTLRSLSPNEVKSDSVLYYAFMTVKWSSKFFYYQILLHDGSRSRILSKKILALFPETNSGARVLFISRQYFDQDKGADMLKKVIIRLQ